MCLPVGPYQHRSTSVHCLPGSKGLRKVGTYILHSMAVEMKANTAMDSPIPAVGGAALCMVAGQASEGPSKAVRVEQQHSTRCTE